MVDKKKKFFFNTANLMKPDSKLVICDFFFEKSGLKESDYEGCNLKITKKMDITEHVRAAILRADRSMEENEIKEHVPWIVKHWAQEQFGLPGSWIYKKMTKKKKDGTYELSYWAYEFMLDVVNTELKLD